MRTDPMNFRRVPRLRTRARRLLVAATAVASAATLSLSPSIASTGATASGPQQTTTSSVQAAPAAAKPRVLVFHGPAKRQDDAVNRATRTVRQLGQNNGFTVEESIDPGIFAGGNLNRFRGVVFLANEGAALNGPQRRGLRAYVRAGGGFLGIHDAAKAQPNWKWFTGLVGARPATSPFKPQKATVDVLDRQHPATRELPLTFEHTGRWPNWTQNPSGKVHTVAQVEESTYQPGSAANGPFHPVSWCHDYQGGRSFYTGMGATAAAYDGDQFRKHLLGAIQWTSGMVRGDCQATIASNYKVEKLTAQNKEGELDQIGEPHGLTVAPTGDVFYVGKAACASGPIVEWDNPDVGLGCGTIHRYDPDSGDVNLLTTLDVMGNRGSGDELVKNEEGLLGIVADPDFSENNWLYVYWMPHESIDREKRIGQRTISRFTYDAENDTIDKGSRKDLLQWPAQIHSCCHAGGGMAFDDDGNLYVGSGDNNSSGGSDGYSGNNWTQDYKGISFQDARRTSGNTNSLNGKIIRIHPEDDGSYTIPAGNLFTGDEGGGDKARPEIYVMGVRNISRLQIDSETDWLTAAWVGPDATEPSPVWGPAKYETATIITSAGNQGWPYCMGNRQPYRNRSNEDASKPTNWYDCDNLKNTSPRNTGLEDIPDARTNSIWYSPQGGGPVYPERNDGSGIPTYELGDETFTEPYLKGGGQAVMSGPTFHEATVDEDSDISWPSYWEDKWLIGDQSNDNNRIAVTMNPATVHEQGPPAFAEDLRNIIPKGTGDNQLMSWMDAKFGKDGALYLLDYGGGFFSLDDRQKLIRISYQGGPATPAPGSSGLTPGAPPADDARVDATPTSQGTPTRIKFAGQQAGGVSWEWDFGDGTTSKAMSPTHTFTKGGTFDVTLEVTYADGDTATVEQQVNVTCPAADSRSTVRYLDHDTGVDNESVGGGCTINDVIDDESEWGSHQQFVAYVKRIAGRMTDDGPLSDTQAYALERAAAASQVGNANPYRPLFDGTPASLNGWEQAPSGSFKRTAKGNLRSSGGLGMLWYAKQEFDDFSLRLQFRDIAPEGYRANSGVFIRFPDPRTPVEERPQGSCGTTGSAKDSQAWVAIFCGQEIQIFDGPQSDEGEQQKTGSVYNFDSVAIDDANPTDKRVWNDYEIRVVGQKYRIFRNGVQINAFTNSPGQESSRDGDPPTDLRQFVSGFIGLQNHSDNDLIEFRNIRVQQR